MIFELTSENKKYIASREKVILNACPGSGKTSAIAYKLTILTQECETKYGHFSGVTCLSFTNVAKDEISEKFENISSQRLQYPHLVSTIDSFVNRYITLPFYYLLGYSTKRPVILNSVDFLDQMNLGYFPNRKRQPLRVSYKPSLLKFEVDGTISWKGHPPNPKVVDPEIFKKFAKKFKKWQLDNGYLNNDDSTYIALKLLEKFPQIGTYLSNRFPYILIDEAQDTSELQYKIFDKLIDNGLQNLEYVGDPYQSLYEFRKARPDLFIRIFEDTENWNSCELMTCRRSSQKIIDFYNIFRKSTEKSITSICKHKTDLPIKIIKYDENNLDGLVNEYKNSIDTKLSFQILVRGSSNLEMFGVKQSQENPWKNMIAKNLVLAAYNFEVGKIKDCINSLRELYVEIKYSNLEYKERLEKENELKEDNSINIKLYEFIKGIPTTDNSITEWSSQITSYIKSSFGVEVDLELKKKGKLYISQNLKQLMYPQTNLQYPVSTIHKAKGMTYNSILLVLSENSSGEKISISDFKNPEELPNEKQRMIYVALSRPETFSCIAVPNKVKNENIRDVFGQIDIIQS